LVTAVVFTEYFSGDKTFKNINLLNPERLSDETSFNETKEEFLKCFKNLLSL